LDRFLGFLEDDTEGLLFSLKVFILERHVILLHFLFIVGLGFIGLETIEFVDFLKGLQRFGSSFVCELSFLSMFLDNLFVLENFLLKVEIVAQMIALLFVWFMLIMLIGLDRLVIDDILDLFLNFIGKLISGEILFAFYNIIFTFAHMNHLSITEIFVSLLFIMNVRQVGGGLVLFATHEPASGLWD
jgi:hypothetical protein